MHQPRYIKSLTLSLRPLFIETCDPVDADNSCHVINGYTIIFLDTGATTAKELAYNAIKAALLDEEYLAEYAPAVASAEFLQSGRDSFVVSPPSLKTNDSTSQSTVTTITIATSSVAFMIVAIFAYGIFRRHPINRSKGLATPSGKASPGHIGIKPGNYYEGLDDEQPSLFHLDINSESPSNTWSVSDITSEGSIRSGLSRATSTLEKIDEETLDEIELFEDEENDEDTDPAPKRSPEIISHFIADFDAVGYHNPGEDGVPEDMESTDESTEECSEEGATCTMIPVGLSTEEAQKMLDDFLLPLSQSQNDVELLARAEQEPQKPSSAAEDDPSSAAEDDCKAREEELRETIDVDEVTGAPIVEVPRETQGSNESDKHKNPVVEEPNEDPVSRESTESDVVETLIVYRDENEVEEKSVGVVDKAEDKEEASECPECSPTPTDRDTEVSGGTATAEDTMMEGKVEEGGNLTFPEKNASCVVTEINNQDCRSEASGSPREESDDDEASSASANKENKELTAASTDTNASVPCAAPETTGKHELAEATQTDHAVAAQGCTSRSENERGTKDTSGDETNTLRRVTSHEGLNGLAVGDISDDDSLALSTDTTEPGEEVSLNGWLTKFLSDMSADKICATQCQTPYQGEEQNAEE